MQVADLDVRDGRYGDDARTASQTYVFLFCNDSTTVEITGYRPQIAIELPGKWRNTRKWNDVAKKAILSNIGRALDSKAIGVEFVERLQFMGYHEHKKKYLIVTCQTMSIRRTIGSKWSKDQKKKGSRRRDPPLLHTYYDQRSRRNVTLKGIPKKFKYYACNKDCPPSVNFLRQINGHMGGWLRVEGASQITRDKRTWSRHQYIARIDNVKGMPKHQGIAVPSLLSYDIEVISDGAFPKPRRPGDQIICVGTYLKDYTSDKTKFKTFVLNEEEHKHPESEMLISFAEYIREVDPDVLTGYNTYGFDNAYIFDRIELIDWFHSGYRKWSDVARARKMQDKYEHLNKLYKYCEDEKKRESLAESMNMHVNNTRSSFKPQPTRIWSIIAGYTKPNGDREPGYETREEFEAARDYFTTEDPDLKSEFYLLLSRKKYVPGRYKRKELKSSAMGEQIISFPSCTGRINLDPFVLIKNSQHRLPNYKLKTVANYFLKDITKIDLPIPTMNEYWKSGEPDKRLKVIEYCERDCELPVLILEKLGSMFGFIEESRLTGVSVAQIVVSGTGCKTKFLLYRRGIEMGYFFNEQTKFPPLESFQGATVVEPKIGFYSNHVLCLGMVNAFFCCTSCRLLGIFPGARVGLFSCRPRTVDAVAWS